MSSITLHPEYGVNPSVMVCFYCIEEASGLVLLGHNKGREAPRQAVYDMVPCDKCNELMTQGIIVIGVRDGEMEKVERDSQDYLDQVEHLRPGQRAMPFIPNPYRNGLWCVVREDFFKSIMLEGKMLNRILRQRWTFIDETTADQIGLAEMSKQIQSEQTEPETTHRDERPEDGG